jgi:hypothetical protein
LSAAPAPQLPRPLFIVAAPRSGSTLLFEALKRHPSLWTLGDESHAEIESIPGLSPAERGFDSNALTAADATAASKAALLHNFTLQLRDVQGRRWLTADAAPEQLQLLEKTPKNALRIPFLDALFPDALFLFIHRDAAENLGSMLDAWQSGRFVTYAELPGWEGPPWSLLLPDGWRKLNGRPLAEVVAQQWRAANESILQDLAQLPRERWRTLDYASLVADPAGTMQRISAFAGLDDAPGLTQALASGLPPSRYTLSAPSRDKWRRHEAALAPVLAGLLTLDQKLKSADNPL